MTPISSGIQSLLDAPNLDNSSPTARAELNSLRQEADPELQSEGLYHWARRQDEAGRMELAGPAFALLGESGGATAGRAAQRLRELQGGGSFGARFERHLRNFAVQAADPAMLVGMAVGATAFSFGRNLALARLANFGGGNLAAAGIGLAAEVPAFWVTSKGLNELRHPGQQHWDLAHNGRELAGLALSLGILRGAGALTRLGLKRLHGVDPLSGEALRFGAATGFTHAVLPRVTMIGGIYASHGIEEALGWRQAQSSSSRLLDSAISVLQFEVGGHLSRRLFPGLARWSRDLESRSQALQSLPPRPPTFSEALRRSFGGLRLPQGAFAVAPLGLGGNSEAIPAAILGVTAMATIGATGGRGEPLGRLPEVAPDELFDWIRTGKDFYLVDIREEPEYAAQGEVRLRNSTRNLRAPLPLDPEREDPAAKEFDLPAFAKNFEALNLDPNVPVLFICRVGNRTNHEVVDGLRLLGLTQDGDAPRFHSLGGGTYGLLSRAMQVAKDPELSQRLQFQAGPDYFKHRGAMANALKPFLESLSGPDR